jgi:hypothetical protein
MRRIGAAGRGAPARRQAAGAGRAALERYHLVTITFTRMRHRLHMFIIGGRRAGASLPLAARPRDASTGTPMPPAQDPIRRATLPRGGA